MISTASNEGVARNIFEQHLIYKITVPKERQGNLLLFSKPAYNMSTKQIYVIN